MGKHITILSPSGAIDSEYIEGASQRLRMWGYTVTTGKHTGEQIGRYAGTDLARYEDLRDALQDSDVILCARGGYGLQRIISDMPDVPKGQRLPLIVGFSDITILHQWAGLQGAVSMHGLMCKHLATLPIDSPILHLWRQAVEGQTLRYEVAAHSYNRPGEAKGILIGGNLSVLYGLQGTPYSLTERINALPAGVKPILFIEDIAERHYHIDRMMLNLKMSGVLAKLGGLMVGQFTDCEEDPSMLRSLKETIADAVSQYDYPVMFNFPAGHVDDNMPLLLGKETSFTVMPAGVTVING